MIVPKTNLTLTASSLMGNAVNGIYLSHIEVRIGIRSNLGNSCNYLVKLTD